MVDLSTNSKRSTNADEAVTRRTINSVYQTCVEHPVLRLLKRSKSSYQQLRRHSFNSLFDKSPKFQRLSYAYGESINIDGTKSTCSCRHDFIDGKCLKNFMEMSVQPAEYRNNAQIMTSTPIIPKNVDYDQNIFNVARVKKVELHDLKPKVPEFHGK